jgi:hypothetical protein
MRKLLRVAAACILALTALSTVEAVTYSQTCTVRCSSGRLFTTIRFSTTYEACCNGDVEQYCPPGYSGTATAWGTNFCYA